MTAEVQLSGWLLCWQAIQPRPALFRPARLPVAVSHDDDGAGQQGLRRLCWSSSMWLRAGGSTTGGIKVQQLLPLCPVRCSVGSAAPWSQATQPVPNCTQQLQQGVPDHGWQCPQASQGVGGGLNDWPGFVSGAHSPTAGRLPTCGTALLVCGCCPQETVMCRSPAKV